MGAYYGMIKAAHIAAIAMSFLLFVLRASLRLADLGNPKHWSLRIPAHGIDTVVLTAALMLVTILHQYPFVHTWLTLKVLLLMGYFGLGHLAIRAETPHIAQRWAFVGAVCCFGLIYAIALGHRAGRW